MTRKVTSRRNHSVAFTPKYRRLRRKKGNDLAFVELNGKRLYLGPYDTTESREAYFRHIAEWEASGRTTPVKADEITVVEVANQFMKWAGGYYVKHDRPTAEPGNITLALRPLLELYGRTPAAEFGPRAIKAVRQKMVDLGWTRKYTNKQVARIKRMFKWAVAEELVPPAVHHSLTAVTGLKYGRSKAPDNAPVEPAPIELVEATKQHVSKQVAAMIDLQLLTGARPGEITILRPCDIDRSEAVWKYRPSEHKTEHHGNDRVIFIGPKAQDILQPFLLRPQEEYCFSPREAEEERRHILHLKRKTPCTYGNTRGTNRKTKPKRQPGLRYTTDTYRVAIARGCKKAFPLPEPLAKRNDETDVTWKERLTTEKLDAQIKDWQLKHHWHPHQLRHNYATNIRKQFGLEAAQILLGHSKADVTQIYAERDMDQATTVAEKIG
jgi:integrase